ncbi:lipoprotein [Geobacter sulfurreducens]|uniref:Lipoprotein, putative n=1 Tax=Geobacter sulfurreducens (strain ATCC 51573 / DSM 12127 / PCA) TaxID=243231 RepID=Q749S0_GEOSL|nr:lipoprotein [Geobacter sulfurreducens]AAR36044.1 lipoprotein, putative [Geobacter sulfurreducens PCA]UAC03369.1 lipoprotein [Geobacter sulfurreducens]HBB68449.1 lipoprotein [Geobacter sulfurreducens]HCD95792.1 lipoprotein [Geobacter sulfurreducens]
MKAYSAGLFLLLACALLPACAGLQIGGGGDSPSALAMTSHGQVRQTIDRLIAAYEAKDSRGFSELVSERYTGEAAILETAVRRDFSANHNLAIRYTVNNITLDDGGKAFAAITFTRSWTDVKTARTMNETRETSLVFIRENGTYRLYSQNGPPLFGLH